MTLDIQVRLRRQDFTLSVNRELPLRGITALHGASGCGKTSLLRVIAGLDRVAGARVRFGDETWQQGRQFLPLHRRRVGLVFQESSLLPHLSVERNLVYGYRRTPTARRRLHPDRVISLLALDGLLQRSPAQLSGGQRQRVALGRALLTSPALMLLDEPLSALDNDARREITPFLSRLAADTGVPMILVTHSASEVEQLADQVAFMDRGRITTVETLRDSLARPDSPLFADDGPASILEGDLGRDDTGDWCFRTRDRGGNPGLAIGVSGPAGQRSSLHRLRIRASDVSLALEQPVRISIRNLLPARIERIDTDGDDRCTVACRLQDGQLLLARITRRSARELELATGQAVVALIKSAALME